MLLGVWHSYTISVVWSFFTKIIPKKKKKNPQILWQKKYFSKYYICIICWIFYWSHPDKQHAVVLQTNTFFFKEKRKMHWVTLMVPLWHDYHVSRSDRWCRDGIITWHNVLSFFYFSFYFVKRLDEKDLF